MSESNHLITSYFQSTVLSRKRPLPEENDKYYLPNCAENKKRRKIVNDTDKRQQRLDFGQSNIGPVYCRNCEYVYEQTNPEDIAAHEKHHNRAQTLDAFKVTPKQLENWKLAHYYREDDNKIYFHVKKISKSTLVKKIDKLLEETLNKELEEESKDIWGLSNSVDGYIYIQKVLNKSSYIGGIAFVEYVKEGKCWKSCKTLRGNFLGLHGIWIHPLIRRKKVGTELLDFVRDVHIPSLEFPRDSFLIDHSTEDFKEFISSYTGKSISEVLTFVTL
uniref:N-acetyltransferase ESCO1 n=1 Tax=Strongyloides venezuelensis TaxID=75913 RepID=A0A0K0F0M1_STRVS